MPVPLPPQHSKPETRKSQSSIVPSDHEPSEKKDEKYQTKISPSSPQGPLKKRSAFEDLTNAPQSQHVQPKKEANNEFVKDTSKKRNKERLPENNKMNIKRCKVELSPIIVSTTMVPNIIDNLLTLDMSTSSKTPNTEEASIFKEPFILKEEPTSEDAVLTKKSLSSKKCTNQEVMSLLKKPLSLQGKSDSDVQPVTFGKKHKTGEAAITNKTLSLKNMCQYQGKQSCLGEELALQDVSVEEDSSFMELQNVRKKPKTEEATFTNPLSSLKKKYTTQRKMSYRKNPLVLQKTTSEEKLLTEESFKRKPTAEVESFFQEPPALQEKHTSEQEISILKKSLAFQEKIDTEEKSLFKEPLAFKKQSTTEETTFTMRPLSLKKKCTTQRKRKMTYMKKTASGEKALTSQLLSFKKKPTPKEESLFQDLSVLQEKHTDDGAVTLLKKPWALQKKDDEDDFLMEPLSFRKAHTTKEATLPKKPLPLKRKCTTQGKMYHLKNPLVLQKVTSEEKSLVKEPLPFKKPPTTKESLFQEPSALQEKHTILEEASILKKPLVLQKTPAEEESLKKETLTFKKFTVGEAASTNMLLSLKEKCTTQGKSCLIKPLVLQTISEDKSLIKEPTTEVESLLKEPSALQEKHTTQGDVAPLKKPWALQERIDSKDEFLMEPLSFRKTQTTNVAVSTEESLSLMKQACATQTIMSIWQELLGLQNMIGKNSVMMPVSSRKKSSTDEAVLTKTLSPKMRQITQWNTVIEKTTSEKESLFKKLLPLKKKYTTEEGLLFQDPSVLKEKHTSLQQASLSKKPLTLEENIATKEESNVKELLTMEKSLVLQKTDTKVDFLKTLLALQKKSTTEEKLFFEKPLVLKENFSPEAAASIEGQSSFKKQPTAQGEVFLLKKQSTLQENITSEEECIIKQPQALQEKPSIEKETILRESLALQENSIIEKEAVWKEPLALQKTLAHKEDPFLKDCTFQIETSPDVSTTTPESGTGLSNTITMSCSTISKSSTCESSFDKPFSSCDKRSQQEMIPLGNTDIDCSDPLFSSVYAKDIFSYMKKREEKFILKKYMTRQTDIDSDMRAILVDWLVEVQMTFEMSHETLYLAVKLVDHYLMKVICKKDKLQLLGSTAFMIAAKFEERCPPSVNDFLYICNDIYKRDEMLAMEASILKILKFDINIPIAYHFLRRYARCVYASMKTLTLSRFICELTLLEYDYVQERASKLAAASFFLALCMNKLGHWAPILEYYSGYRISDLHALVRQLNILLTFHSCNRLKTVCSKYSHKIFFEVAKIPPLDMLALEKILRCC